MFAHWSSLRLRSRPCDGHSKTVWSQQPSDHSIELQNSTFLSMSAFPNCNPCLLEMASSSLSDLSAHVCTAACSWGFQHWVTHFRPKPLHIWDREHVSFMMCMITGHSCTKLFSNKWTLWKIGAKKLLPQFSSAFLTLYFFAFCMLTHSVSGVFVVLHWNTSTGDPYMYLKCFVSPLHR